MKKFVVLALILAGVALFQFAPDFENAFSEPPPAVEEPLPEKAFVYVTGAVKNPGLYALETGKTAGEAVEAAGGMIAYADTGAVNLADRAEDGAHIHVPYDFQGIPENPAEAGKVSLNRADEKALTDLPGIDVICDKYLHPEYHEVCVSLDDDEMGGGGGGYNPPSNPPETPPTPCKRAKTLSQDAAFKSRIKDVYRKTFSSGNTVEQGFIQTSDGQTIFPNVQESGSAKFTNDQIAGKEIMEWYHSHPTGSMITSWADLKALAIRYQQGYVKSENFTYGVVSEFGCMSIMITSPTDFNTFATKVRNGELSESWNAYIVGASGGGVDECIGQLLKFLDRNNSGLSVMFSSNIDESNPTWNAQELASNGKSVNMECNQ